MREFPIWWPIRGLTIGILSASIVHAVMGRWQIALGALVWLVLVLFISFTRPAR